MSHSHLAIRHLVRKLEMGEPRKPIKANLPAWLVQFVEDLAQRFEPFRGVARAGYECLTSESGWEVALFLGEQEMMGGADDGQLRPINFRFNLLNLTACFDVVDTLFWNAFPSSHVCFEDVADLSFLAIEGIVHSERVRVQIHAGPPDSVGPGLRQHADGRLELV